MQEKKDRKTLKEPVPRNAPVQKSIPKSLSAACRNLCVD